jgi:hypothetical protein
MEDLGSPIRGILIGLPASLGLWIVMIIICAAVL